MLIINKLLEIWQDSSKQTEYQRGVSLAKTGYQKALISHGNINMLMNQASSSKKGKQVKPQLQQYGLGSEL